MSAAPEPEDFHDAALRRALGHAPDHAAAPDWRLRKAILQQAHEAVAPSSGSLLEESNGSPWWKRLGGGKARGSRMPWNAAFATVLIAGLATVLWQREPVPGARPDGEAQVAAPPPAPSVPAERRIAAPAAPAPQAVSPPASLPIPVPGLAPVPPPPLEPQPEREPALSIVLDPPPPPEPVRPQPDEAAPPPPRPGEAGERRAKQALAARTARDEEAAARQRMSPPPSPPATVASQGDAAAPARAARAPAPTPAVRTADTEPPTFAALSQWNRITIAQRGGATRSLSRAEAADLNALLGSAAISAVRGDPLAGTPEWRITLERNSDVLAVLEVARSQVRWREGREPPATGAPSAAALAALRNALLDAVAPPQQPPQR